MNRSKSIQLMGILLLVFAVLLAGCRVDTSDTPTPDTEPAHWSYEGDTAPARWASLDDDYERCAAGLEQSPVNLSGSMATPDDGSITFGYQPSALKIVNNGHTIQAVYDAGSSILVEGTQYDLLQFHLHAESEHTIDDARYPMELHLVHRNAEGDLAVVGILLDEGSENDGLEPLLTHMPREESHETFEVEAVEIDAGRFLPTERRIFEYPGSLTTPPCSEGVRWFVMAQPVEMSADQIAAFTELYSGNYRPLQPLNEREVRLAEELEAER